VREAGRDELAAARELMQGALDALPARLAVLDERGEVIMTNRAWREFAEANGAVATADLGSNYLAVCDGAPEDEVAREVAAGLRELLEGARPSLAIEYPCHSPAGETAWFELRASRHDGLETAHLIVAHEDITPRRRAQAEAQGHAAVLDDLEVAVIAVDEEGALTSWNDACERMFGWTREEALGANGVDLLTADSPDAALELVEQTRMAGHRQGELEMKRKDGTKFTVEVHHRLLLDERGDPAGRTAVFIDITERREAERALTEPGTTCARSQTRWARDSARPTLRGSSPT
jgi:two-component system CheB/CheR fusion protein